MTGKSACRSVALLILFGILVGGFPGLSPRAFGKTQTVVTAGTTLILEGNLARARNVAIANGKRNALETAVRGLISEDVANENYDVINQHIYQRQERFIDTYRILSETSRGNVYEATLETDVAVEKLRMALVTLGLLEEEPGTAWSRFRLEIGGVSCPSCFRALKAHLSDEVDGVEELSLYSIRPGVFTLDVVFKGDIETFRDALMSMTLEDFHLDLEGMDEGYLQVRMVLTHPEPS